MRHARPQGFLELEVGGKGPVPIEQTLAIVPQGERTIEAFDSRTQSAFGRLDPVLGLLALGNIQQYAAIDIRPGLGMRRHTATQFHPAGRLETGHETGLHPAVLVAFAKGVLNPLLMLRVYLRQHFINRDLAIAQHAHQLGCRIAEINRAGIV